MNFIEYLKERGLVLYITFEDYSGDYFEILEPDDDFMGLFDAEDEGEIWNVNMSIITKNKAEEILADYTKEESQKPKEKVKEDNYIRYIVTNHRTNERKEVFIDKNTFSPDTKALYEIAVKPGDIVSVTTERVDITYRIDPRNGPVAIKSSRLW